MTEWVDGAWDKLPGERRPFLVGEDLTARGRVLTIHIACSKLTFAQKRHLRRAIVATGNYADCVVRRYSPVALEKARSLQKFIRPFLHNTLHFDPTCAFGRARSLVALAGEIRLELGASTSALFWDGQSSKIHICLNAEVMPRDQAERRSVVTSLQNAVGKIVSETRSDEGSGYIKGVHLSIGEPRIAAVPIDDASLPKRSYLTQLKKSSVISALATAFGIGGLAVANAGQSTHHKAVSEPNAKFSVLGGVRDDEETFLSEGALTVPLGEQFGAHFEGTAGVSNDAFMGGATGHLFWRNPLYGLFGITAGYGSAKHGGANSKTRGAGLVAAEGEVYLGQVTLSSLAGYQFGDNGGKDGFTGSLGIGLYATENLLLTLSGETNPNYDALGRLGIEYLPGFAAIPGLSFFAEGAYGDHDYYRVFAGIRFYFGPSPTLLQKHRFDTYRSHQLATRLAESATRRYGS